MTSGNHIFDKREVIPYIEKQPRLLRPANYPPNSPGSGMWIGEIKGVRVAVLNLIGRVFMGPADDPFRAAEESVSSIPADVMVRICAAVIDIDETTGKAREISRLSLPHEQ